MDKIICKAKYNFRFIDSCFFSVTIILLLFIIFSQAFAQVKRVNLDHISNEEGLSQNTVHYILQDSEGFMWFATEDGLNRYDGYNFKVYKNNPSDKNSISDNFIWTLFEDRNGDIWVGTNNGGLCKFDRTKEVFTSYRYDPENSNSISFNNIRAIYEDSEGNLWIGTEGGGLDMFDREKNVFVHYRSDSENPNSLSNNVVLSIFESGTGELWIGSDGGLDKFNYEQNEFTNFDFNPNNGNDLNSNVVLSINEDSSGSLWVGTLNGITNLNKYRNSFTGYSVSQSGSGNPNSSRINTIMEDSEGILWIGTGGGLYQFNRQNNEFSAIKPLETNSTLLDNKNVLSLYEDSSGLVWIGTAEDGIVKFDRERTKFKHYKYDPYNPNSLSHNTVRSIYQEKNGTVWIGTLGGGLNRFDRENEKFYHYKSDGGKNFSLSDNSVSAIRKDSYGYLWVGTWNGGLCRTISPVRPANINDIKFKTYRHSLSDSTSLSSNIIQAVYEDSEKNIWIGTGIGLALYNRPKDNFVNFINDPDDSTSISGNQVQSCIIEDSDGNLWIGTWDGLNKIRASEKKSALNNPASVDFIRYTFRPDNEYSLSDNRVISAYEDEHGNLWFGTYGGGLNKLSKEQSRLSKPKFINYAEEDGLPSNIIYNIQGDNNGNIWLATDNGLSMFTPETESFKNYDVSDGLQGNQFFWGAGFKGNDGELFFGGTNGFNIFYPDEIKNNVHIPPVIITEFQIFNKPVEIGIEDSPLQKVISETERIELSYSQNVFSFEFAALDFTAPNRNRYAYMMEGFDKDWIYSGNRRFVTYTNLDPGEYIFRVKGSNNDGIWNEEGTAVTLIILPPLWMEWWFILLSFITVIGIIAFLIIYRVRHLLNIERFRARLAADLHDNIGSSLTEISIWSEIISKKIKNPDKDVERSLDMISNKSRSLIDNMSDIVWLVNPKRDTLYDLILRLRDTYSELSSYTSISFKSENIKALEKISLTIEHRQNLYLIFKEAINNCISHSECTEISLDAFVKGKKLEMVLEDNGKGFDENEYRKGNGLDNMKNRAKLIGGSVLINSVIGKGTVLKFEGNIL